MLSTLGDSGIRTIDFLVTSAMQHQLHLDGLLKTYYKPFLHSPNPIVPHHPIVITTCKQ